MSLPVKVRTARKRHYCSTHGIYDIHPGDPYELWTEEPKGEVFNADGWVSLKGCASAAVERGRNLYVTTTQEHAHADD